MPTIMGLTGHRPPRLGGYSTKNPIYLGVKERLIQLVQTYKPDKIITGMAQGFDTMGAEVAYSLGIPFVAAIPFNGQQNPWPAGARTRYIDLLGLSSEMITVTQSIDRPYPFTDHARNQCYFKRDKYIVDNSTLLVACFDGEPMGGTYKTVEYAKTVGREMVVINPRNL